mmetsp:Transcript_118421/g.339982  ORF Transcript_118421/g.339982 Transcript_118421/m.339982 type:complete len:598 (-) Transcript_118421:278-2071(-)
MQQHQQLMGMPPPFQTTPSFGPPPGAPPGMLGGLPPPQMPPEMFQQLMNGQGATGPHGMGMGLAPPGFGSGMQAPNMAPPPGLPPGFPSPGMPGGQPSVQPGGAPDVMQQLRDQQEEQRRQPARRGESREQAELREKMAEVEKVRCHLHKKPKENCKFCKKHKDLLDEVQKKGQDSKGERGNDKKRRKPDRAISEERDGVSRGPLELANPKTFGFSGLLQTHIVECAHFKSLLALETFEQLVDETYQFANSVEPYMANSATLPSALFCCLYRFFTMGLDSHNLKRLLENAESPYIRCAGFLYVRYGLPHDQLLGWLSEYLIDDEEFKPTPDSDYKTTVGEYVEGLLSQEKYFNAVLPRLPMVTKRAVEERLAPLGQNRKRMQANKHILDVFREPGLKIECSIGGEWIAGSVVELDEDPPNRPKIRARLDDGSEEYVHLGKVIVTDRNARIDRFGGRGGGGRGCRSRSRSRNDWSRFKGKSDRELIDEMRSRERERAVCSSGKDYARKPVGYKAACALPREQGQASYRLMEEETFVPMARGSRRRSPTPERESAGKRPSAEHQARMQQLFEKYGNQKSAEAGGSRHDDIDRADVMRLG